jgi:hypothetical protein
MKRTIKILVFVIVVAAAATSYFWLNGTYRTRIVAKKAQIAEDIQQKIVFDDLQKNAVSAVQNSPGNPDTPAAPDSQPVANIPVKFLLDMPFYSQAPNGNWDAFHEEMCEEASLLNAGLYLEGKKLSAADYDKELVELKDLEEKTVGAWKSTTIAETGKVSDAYFAGKVQSKIIDNPTIEQIDSEVAAGHPIIIPLAGREIGNPNYTPPGPIYHMLVVKGYDEKFFITNDVGTRKGNSYVYKKNVLMDNMHDWNEKDIHLGAKRILVLFKI